MDLYVVVEVLVGGRVASVGMLIVVVVVFVVPGAAKISRGRFLWAERVGL